mgnify:CR=1 FL=1
MMTPRQQVATLKRIVNQDAEIRGMLCDAEGRMCALGGLGHAVGFSKRWLQRVRNYAKLWRRVCKRFPILRGVGTSDIHERNDRYDNLTKRRTALCRFFEGLVKED